MIDPIRHAADARPRPEDESADAEARRGILGQLVSGLLSERASQSAGGTDARILVVGTFGTDAVADHLQSILARRGRDVGTVSVAGTEGPGRTAVPQPPPAEALIVEAAGPAPSRLREVGEALGPPDVVVVTAVGRDDRERLGPEWDDAVRAFASAVPPGAHVINAERAPAIRRYLGTAIRRRGATIEHVRTHDEAAPGAELAAAIDATLAALDEPPLPTEERDALVSSSRPEWVRVPEGRVYDAVGVTDAVAVERLRSALAGGEAVALVAGLARDRRDVAAAFAEYVDARSAALAAVHAVGPLSARFAEHCPVEVVEHGPEPDPDAVLDDALSTGPALLVGSDRVSAATALSSAVTERISRSGPARIG